MSKEELTEKFTNLNFNELSGEINSSCAKIQEFKGILSYIKNLEDQYKDQDRSFEFYFSFYSGCWDGIGEFLKEVENEKMKKQNFEELSKRFIKNLFDNIGLKKFEEYFTDKSTFETIAKLKDICKDTEEYKEIINILSELKETNKDDYDSATITFYFTCVSEIFEILKNNGYILI